MSAAEFRSMATSKAARPPKRGHAGDDLLERAFWSGITFNPPLYGADTPTSLFDRKLPLGGWNLRALNCLLTEYKVPEISGVTSPMTYFGTWRSFFGWHKEDCDLMSVNYLHMGAPKIWYIISPKDAEKFDSMARQLFPDGYRACRAFTRHKDIMISPKVLRTYNVPFVQAKQRAGEFIVLNHSAYHMGFNLGFNCAEAVNFALPSWMEAGRNCIPCECGALPDGVQLDMSIFFPKLYDNASSEDEEKEEDAEDGSDAKKKVKKSIQGSKRKHHANDAKEPTAKKRRGRLPKSAIAKEVALQDGNLRILSASPERTLREGGRCSWPRIPELTKPSPFARTPKKMVPPAWGPVAEPFPIALVTKEPGSNQIPKFELVHRLRKQSAEANTVWVGVLHQGLDGLFRPGEGTRLVELKGRYPKLVKVKTEWVQTGRGGAQRQGGWRLSTLQKRIVM